MGIIDKIFGKNKSKIPEDDFTVTLTNDFVKVEHPQRKTEQIYWESINEIRLVNTNDGPFLPDVWLTLVGDDSSCLIPQGAKGYDNVYDIVSKYNNFNFENVIKSATCTNNEQFLLWKK